MFKVRCNIFLITAIMIADFLFFIINVFADVNNITQIKFVSDEQIIKRGEASKVFTIQTQNIDGVAEEINESTNKLTLSTDSSTGEFSSSNSDWKSTSIITMNKGTKNKNFYYKDSSVGIFTITAQLVSGETAKTWVTTQTINISDDLVTDNPVEDDISTTTDTYTTNTNSTSTVATTTTITQTKTKYVYISTHYSSEDLSDYIAGNKFEISAGRDRISYVGTPIYFNAKHNKKDKKVNFNWSFGDGTSGIGQEISHFYENPGDYIVVLNSKSNIEDAVSRANIKILKPNLKIDYIDGGLEIINDGDYEINIGEWNINNGYKDIVIPKDTIIASKNKIIISSNVLAGFQSIENLSLVNQSGNIFMSNYNENDFDVSLNNKNLLISNEFLEKTLGMSIKDAENIVYTYRNNMDIDKKIKESKLISNNNVTVDYIDNIATINEIVISTTTEDTLKKVINFPIKNVIKILSRFYDL